MKNFLKKVLKAYFKGVNQMYGPAIRAGVNPYIQYGFGILKKNFQFYMKIFNKKFGILKNLHYIYKRRINQQWFQTYFDK